MASSLLAMLHVAARCSDACPDVSDVCRIHLAPASPSSAPSSRDFQAIVGYAFQCGKSAHRGVISVDTAFSLAVGTFGTPQPLRREHHDRANVSGLDLRFGLCVVQHAEVEIAADHVDHDIAAAAERYCCGRLQPALPAQSRSARAIDAANMRDTDFQLCATCRQPPALAVS